MKWPILPLAKLCRIETGRTPSRAHPEYFGGDNVWATIADLNDGTVSDSKEHVTDDAVAKAGMRPVSAGTVLLSYKLSLGKLGIAGKPLYTNEAIAALPPRPGIDLAAKFLFYALRTVDYLALCHGAVKGKCLNRASLSRIPVPYPPPSEQRRIVEILDQADALRKKCAEADARAAHILPALFYKMFGDPATNIKGWSIEPFGNLGALDRGKSRHRPRNAPELLGGPYPFIQTGDVANSKYYIKTYSSTYSEIGLAQSKMWPAGTLCITIAANIAASSILSFDACFPDSVVGFTPGPRTNSAYIQVLLGFLRPIIERSAPQVAQKNINLQILRKLPVPVPPKNLQDKFLLYYENCSNSLSSQENIKQRINSLWDVLLHRAFTGDLTAKWREAHLNELLAEMEAQAKALGMGKQP